MEMEARDEAAAADALPIDGAPAAAPTHRPNREGVDVEAAPAARRQAAARAQSGGDMWLTRFWM